MLSLDKIIANAIIHSIRNEIASKKLETMEQQLRENFGLEITDIFHKFEDMKIALFNFTSELKNIEDKILNNFLIVEKDSASNEIWLMINNRYLTELILKTFADEDKKTIIDLIRNNAETIPRILERCGLPNTSGYRKMNQLIEDNMIISTGLTETFEGKRAILYKSVIHKIQIFINKNNIQAKIQIDKDMLDSSEIIQTIMTISKNNILVSN